MATTYNVAWKKDNLDLTELARLRWIEKWKIERIAEYFGRSPNFIKKGLRKIEANPDLAKIQLAKCKKRPWTLNVVFRGK